MAFVKGKDKTGGRKKGIRNKTTVTIKKIFEDIFNGSGGVQSAVDWVNESSSNRLEFYKLFSKLIPLEPLDVNLSTDGNITIEADKDTLEA